MSESEDDKDGLDIFHLIGGDVSSSSVEEDEGGEEEDEEKCNERCHGKTVRKGRTDGTSRKEEKSETRTPRGECNASEYEEDVVVVDNGSEINSSMPVIHVESVQSAKAEKTAEDANDAEEPALACFEPASEINESESTRQFVVHRVIDTLLPADSVELCPFPLECALSRDGESRSCRLLALGTYLLDESSGCKKGSVQFYGVTRNDGDGGDDADDSKDGDNDDKGDTSEDTASPRVFHLCDVGTNATFNLRWRREVLGVVTANSTLDVYRLRRDEPLCEYRRTDNKRGDESVPKWIQRVTSSSADDDVANRVHYTNLDWSDAADDDSTFSSIAISQSDGRVSTWTLNESGSLRRRERWLAHVYPSTAPAEVWAVAFSKSSPHVVYSGADDCKLKAWDTRSSCDMPSMVCGGVHEMGVTAIVSHDVARNLLVTGSYDEYLRVFDIRRMRHPLSSLACGGGVWKIQPCEIPTGCDTVATSTSHRGFRPGLVAACMRGGVRCAVLTSDGLKLTSSLAFGGALMYGVSTAGPASHRGIDFASCSFYERSLYIWGPRKRRGPRRASGG